MAATSRYVGDQLRVVFETGGASYDLDGDQTQFEATWNTQLADVTAAVDGGIEEKATQQEIGYTLTTFHIGSSTALWAFITPGVEGTLLYGPQGTATGDPRGGSRAIVSAKPLSVPFNEGVTRQIEFRGQGTMIHDVDNDVWA